jgi:hypothetical protein
MEKMEESYRRTGQDLEKKINSGSISLDQSGNIDIDPLNPTSAQTPNSGLKVRGTKSLMEGLRDILGAEIEDVKPIEENENSVVNAKKKAEIDASRNILLDEDDKLEIDEDLFS